MEATTGVGPFVGQPAAARRGDRVATRAAAASRAADWPRHHPPAALGPLRLRGDALGDPLRQRHAADRDAGRRHPRPTSSWSLLAGVWLLSASAEPRDRVGRARSPIHWAFAIFTRSRCSASSLHDEALVRVGGLDLAIKQLALLASYGVFFALAASIIRPSEVPKLITAMLALACFTAVAVIVEYRFGINVFHDWIGPLFPGYVRAGGIGGVDSIGRKLIYGPTVQPLAVAVMLSMALPFAFAWLLKAKERRERMLYCRRRSCC